MRNMFISIIIPIYNAERYLENLFNSLKKQTLNKSNFEVLFIDNNSNDKSHEMITKFVNNFKNNNYKYYFFNKKQGSYASRNFGVSLARGNIFAFTDADCILEEKWLENIWKFYEVKKNKNIIVAGNIEIIIEKLNNLWEQYDKIVSLNNEKYVKNNSAATANLITPKEIFLNVGEFKELFSGGDSEWTKRAFEKGYNLKFMPNIKVYHPSRKNFIEARDKIFRIGIGRGRKIACEKKSIILNIFLYFLRIFYIATNIKISIKLIKKVGINKTILFNICFFWLRIFQLIGVYKGYKNYNNSHFSC